MSLEKLAYLLLSGLILTLPAACGSGSSQSETISNIREAEAAVATGDMEAARSVAVRVMGDDSFNDLPASELARLSLVYMQIADSTERESSISQAADLYRKAFDVNPDSAEAFYADVNPEMYPYVTMLRTLVGHIDHPYNPEADSLDENSHYELPEPTDLPEK